MRIQQSAQLDPSSDQPQLIAGSGCASCASPCGARLWSAPAPNNLQAVPQPVVVAVESLAFNQYVALVFGLPLVGLFVLAALFGSDPVSSSAYSIGELALSLLSVALLLLFVTTLCRSVARRFERKLKLEIWHQKPHKT